ncbi:AbgT family transporter [Fretibacterium sp. OH1220_COT-178]|uniref:AbgT family transporter n=1 Tax=Fretibacterium sp. OH1220_COT-178 TaxID=2491047 RepID=UPI000F5FE65A|nr:AbgT family transporter [Fretibacterium sp. OH1220_COT-178]RRD64674.1 AbgT family transporter [Fretibacterium sp. OH1220_COT-178]
MVELQRRKGLLYRFLDAVERGGNRLPDPVTIFVILTLFVMVLSAICAHFGLSVTYEGVDRASNNEIKMLTVKAVSLLTADGLRGFYTSMVKNFTGYAPLGTVLVALIGVGLADGSGLLSALIRKMVLSTPKRLVTLIMVFAGVMSNIASDAGYVVLVPLGAIVFMNFGRHPLAGMAAAFAGVSGGFSANLLIGTIDPLLGGISTEAARLLSPDYVVHATANWYFMIASTLLITLIGTFITEKIVEPRLGEYKGDSVDISAAITESEKKGLRYAGITMLVFIALTLLATVPSWGLLRDPKTGDLLRSPFMTGLVSFIMFFFLVPGLAYGIGSGSICSDKQAVAMIGKSMSTMGGYLVLAFAAAQFLYVFNVSKLGTILAVEGAIFLKAINFTGTPLVIAFILISAFINLFMGSASAKWSIMAPVFVPMFMGIGFSPEFTQCIYRIGDSSTNIITPLMTYFAFIVACVQKYDKDAGIGTLISMMLPYSVCFLIAWSTLMAVWFGFDLPLGPGVGIFLK